MANIIFTKAYLKKQLNHLFWNIFEMLIIWSFKFNNFLLEFSDSRNA